MSIPSLLKSSKTPAKTAQIAPSGEFAPEPVERTVTDMTFAFLGGQTYSFTLREGDTIDQKPETYYVRVNKETIIIERKNLLFSSSVARTEKVAEAFKPSVEK